MMNRPNESHRCRTDEHTLHRRLFLKGLTGGALASATSFTGLFHNPMFAAETRRAQKHCILLWLCGAPSQFETGFISLAHSEEDLAKTADVVQAALKTL